MPVTSGSACRWTSCQPDPAKDLRDAQGPVLLRQAADLGAHPFDRHENDQIARGVRRHDLLVERAVFEELRHCCPTLGRLDEAAGRRSAERVHERVALIEHSKSEWTRTRLGTRTLWFMGRKSSFDVLKTYLEARGSFTAEEFAFLRTKFTALTLRRGEFLQRAGTLARYTGFVAWGCARKYAIDATGKEHIVAFAPETWWVADGVSLTTGTPSQFFIDAIEDSDLLLIDAASHEQLVERVPGYAAAYRRTLQRAAASRDAGFGEHFGKNEGGCRPSNLDLCHGRCERRSFNDSSLFESRTGSQAELSEVGLVSAGLGRRTFVEALAGCRSEGWRYRRRRRVRPS